MTHHDMTRPQHKLRPFLTTTSHLLPNTLIDIWETAPRGMLIMLQNEWKRACSLWCRLFLRPKEHTVSCNSTIYRCRTNGNAGAAACTDPQVCTMGLRATPIYIVELNDTVCSFGLRNNLHHRLHVCFHSFCSIISIPLGAVSQMSMAINDFRLSRKGLSPIPITCAEVWS